VDCPNHDISDATFGQATTVTGGCDIVDEFLACGIYPLSVGFGFKNVTTDTTVVLKVEVPLPIFPVEAVSMEITYHFLVKVEIDAEKILGSYRAKEHDACEMVKLSNGSCLNRVFKHMGVPYAPHPLLGTDAFTVATKKQKVNVSRKTVMKKGEVCPSEGDPSKCGPNEEDKCHEGDPAETKTQTKRYIQNRVGSSKT
jgi:hypothetical protein